MEQLMFNFSGLEKKASSENVQASRQSSPGKSTKIDYTLFSRLAGDSRLMPYAIFEQTDWKKRILKQAGYDKVHGVDSIDDATPAQIGQVFANTYKLAKTRA